jgi:uncharacterized protein (DUF2267 family)
MRKYRVMAYALPLSFKQSIMPHNFQQYAEEGNRFINTLSDALGNPDDTAHASRVTNAIFKAIRDRITPAQSMHIVSQLPMALKGVYVDGWKMSDELSNAKTQAEFFEDIRMHAAAPSGRDFGNDQQMGEIVRIFFGVLRDYVDDGELRHIAQQLPEGIAELIEEHV